MTRDQFIEVLNLVGYSFETEGNKIIINHEGDVYLQKIDKIPSDIEFRNGSPASPAAVYLTSLKIVPPNVIFNNNYGNVYLDNVEKISPGVEFRNIGNLYLRSLFGGWVFWRESEAKIHDISLIRLLNLMIKKGLFI